MGKRSRAMSGVTIGMDLGDKYSRLCVLDADGEVLEESRIPTTRRALERRFRDQPPCRVVVETGTHSPWVQRLLTDLGHEAITSHARQVRLIYASKHKDDSLDAERLARLGRVDPQLLHPIQPRGESAQIDRAVLRSRTALVESRTRLINHARGMVKSLGSRLPSCSAGFFHRKVLEEIPEALRPALQPILETIGELTQRIRAYDRGIEQLSRERYPETDLLRQVTGVGAITALSYVLTIEDPRRFRRSRTVGAYLGLSTRRSQSGEHDPELRITRAGDMEMRRLLVGSAHYILGPFGPDCDLRRWGLSLAERGRKNAKKRAIVAVARKLAVLLHRLWISAEVYEPFRRRAAAA